MAVHTCGRYIKYTHKVGYGNNQWDIDRCTVHSGEMAFTTCGRQIGTIEKGWEVTKYTGVHVTCKRCIKILDKKGRL